MILILFMLEIVYFYNFGNYNLFHMLNLNENINSNFLNSMFSYNGSFFILFLVS